MNEWVARYSSILNVHKSHNEATSLSYSQESFKKHPVCDAGILQGLDFSEVAEALLNIDGVVGVRQLRIWALTMDRVSLSVLLSIGKNQCILNSRFV